MTPKTPKRMKPGTCARLVRLSPRVRVAGGMIWVIRACDAGETKALAKPTTALKAMTTGSGGAVATSAARPAPMIPMPPATRRTVLGERSIRPSMAMPPT